MGPIRSERVPRISKAKRKNLDSQLMNAALKIAEGGLETAGEFTVDDLIGKIIADHVRIGYPEVFHPERQSPNPGSLDVTVYSDMTFQMSRVWGDGGCAHVDRYYFDGNKFYHSEGPD